MNLHRFLCAFGRHFFVKLGRHWRGCCVCHQQQRYIEDVFGRHGFWMNVMPQGRVGETAEQFENGGRVDAMDASPES